MPVYYIMRMFLTHVCMSSSCVCTCVCFMNIFCRYAINPTSIQYNSMWQLQPVYLCVLQQDKQYHGSVIGSNDQRTWVFFVFFVFLKQHTLSSQCLQLWLKWFAIPLEGDNLQIASIWVFIFTACFGPLLFLLHQWTIFLKTLYNCMVSFMFLVSCVFKMTYYIYLIYVF